MKKNLKWIVGVGGLVLFIVAASVLYNYLSESYTPVKPETETSESEKKEETEKFLAPDFAVFDKDKNIVKLSEMKGKPVVVNFWASWCPPCKAELPDFEKMYEKYGEDIYFMMVNMTDGQQETFDKAKAYIEENGYTFPVYYDMEFSAAMEYGIVSLPMTVFIDAEGYLVSYANGMIDAATLEERIEMIR